MTTNAIVSLQLYRASEGNQNYKQIFINAYFNLVSFTVGARDFSVPQSVKIRYGPHAMSF